MIFISIPYLVILFFILQICFDPVQSRFLSGIEIVGGLDIYTEKCDLIDFFNQCLD